MATLRYATAAELRRADHKAVIASFFYAAVGGLPESIQVGDTGCRRRAGLSLPFH